MTCPARLTVVAGDGWLSKTFEVPCINPKAHKLDGGQHQPDLRSLPLRFSGTPGKWVARITVR